MKKKKSFTCIFASIFLQYCVILRPYTEILFGHEIRDGRVCTVCSRSLDQIYIVTYYVKLVNTFLADIIKANHGFHVTNEYVY